MDATQLRDLLRGWPWLGAAIATTSVVAVVAPAQVGVLIWSLSKLAIGAYLGYWMDRSLFPYARPHEQDGADASAAWMRRSIVVGAVVVALGLGV